MPFNELRKEDGVRLALPSCSRNAHDRNVLVGRAQLKGDRATAQRARLQTIKKKSASLTRQVLPCASRTSVEPVEPVCLLGLLGLLSPLSPFGLLSP